MDLLDLLPPPMREPVLFAIPFFLLLLSIESVSARNLEHLADDDRPGAEPVAEKRPYLLVRGQAHAGCI